VADKKRILVVEVVEDSKELLNAISDKLVGEGYEVARLTNGKTGLDWALENHPDIILLDLQMPIMDGKEMLEKLRKDKWGSKAPVIILTNESDNTSIYEVIGIGSSSSLNDYCVKADTSLEEIVGLIQQKLSKSN
jgi:DNA-binding response OmpR family regulator